MNGAAVKYDQMACDEQARHDVDMYDIGHREGIMRAREDLANPVANIMHEVVKMVGLRQTLVSLSRVVGTFMLSSDREPPTAQDADLISLAESIFSLTSLPTMKRLDPPDYVRPVVPCTKTMCVDRVNGGGR